MDQTASGIKYPVPADIFPSSNWWRDHAQTEEAAIAAIRAVAEKSRITAFSVDATGKPVATLADGTKPPASGSLAITLTVGTVNTGAAAASITGAWPNPKLNLTLPPGPRGTTGDDGAHLVSGRVTDTGGLDMLDSAGRTITITGDLRGPQGPPGPNAIPADEAVAGYLATTGASATQAAADERYATAGILRSKVKTDGSDQTTTLQGEINTLAANGGGTLLLPRGTIRLAGTLTMPNDGATPPKQAPLTIVGTGTHWSGRGTVPTGGTILDIRGTDTYGKLKTNGLGYLGLHEITFRDTGGGNTPFLYTTNTTLDVQACAFVGSKTGVNCDQDAIILGGVEQIEGQGGWTHGFQGYGTRIVGCFFSAIRRCVYGRAFANAIVVRENTIWTTCGNTAGGAIEFDGKPGTGPQACMGNVIAENLIELPNYQYGIKLANAVSCTLGHNNFFDSTANTTAAIRLESTAKSNIILEGAKPAGSIPALSDAGADNWFYALSQGLYSKLPPSDFADVNYPLRAYGFNLYGPGGLVIQPDKAKSDSSPILTAKRSAAETTAPSEAVLTVFQNGRILYGPNASQGGNWQSGNAQSSGGGRNWSAIGTNTPNGGPMSQDSGPGGSYFDHRNYGVRFYDHNGGPLRATIGAGIDGMKLGAAGDAFVKRAAANTTNVGRLAVENVSGSGAAMPSSAWRKLEIFDAAGVSVGFIPVFQSL